MEMYIILFLTFPEWLKSLNRSLFLWLNYPLNNDYWKEIHCIINHLNHYLTILFFLNVTLNKCEFHCCSYIVLSSTVKWSENLLYVCCNVLCYTVMYCAVLCYTVWYSAVLCSTVLYYAVLCCTVLYWSTPDNSRQVTWTGPAHNQ